ncbi:hypothetical protein TARUN_7259 [Trichoderma arundinaceum]|uniref:DUF8004 domain-containing protein n=1 Tax=Trichoderma arundinaceum TaxID=490622 RepID=A0A395NFS5_TRIAR|nr:hypothetical protein TARUN_7259 [Trichoderma arundinaceum]
MAGLRARSNSVRRARGLSIGEDGKPVPLKRWDGAGRTCREWDGLRRVSLALGPNCTSDGGFRAPMDPEIWERNGNCLVYLYAKGDSKRGPSFKLPFASLIVAGCLPLIEKFLVLDGLASRTAQEIERWDQLHPRSTAELYIPAPPRATERQAQHYHVAIRNLFAWVLGKPMVGGHLGSALVTLLHSMREFRSTAGSNLDDLLEYMRQAQYLDMAEAPVHATAALYVAETFQLGDLYKRAFAHCVGMHDRLFYTSEYQIISAISRTLVRKARLEMNIMLQQTSHRLRSFLDEDLSETNLGIPAGTRAHLERFRSFLLSFYAAKLGYYPPRTFSARLLSVMAEDFDALYELLVDNNYTVSDIIPSTAVGGICTEQLVQTFDENNKFEPLQHPLPQLPQLESSFDGLRRLSKLPFVEKVATGQRQVTVAALITASNWTEKCFRNDLVQAYRRFEEDAILFPSKADKSEKISLLEARKVRWVMIYAVHQVLRSATRKPIEVQDEVATYHLTVSMDGTPPWSSGSHEAKKPLRIQTDIAAIDELATKRSVKIQETAVGKIEIKPDIDYFALTHKSRNPSLSTMSDNLSPTTLSRSSSFSISLRRNSTIRRSLRRFRRSSMSGSQPSTPPPAKPLYHEIVVQGYGNGTQAVTVEPEEEGLLMKGTLAGRSDSTASTQSNASSSTTASSTPESMSSTIDTLSTSALSSPATPITDAALELEPMLSRWGPQDKAPVRTALPRSASVNAISGQMESLAAGFHSYTGALDRKEDCKRKRRSLEPARSAPAPTALQRRYTMLGDLRRMNFGFEAKPISVRIRENSITEETWTPSRRDSDDWSMMLAFMDGTDAEAKANPNDAYAQYSDLGGLTDMS